MPELPERTNWKLNNFNQVRKLIAVNGFAKHIHPCEKYRYETKDLAMVGVALYGLVGANLAPYVCVEGGQPHWHLHSIKTGRNSRTVRTSRTKKRKKFRTRLWSRVESPQEPGPLGCILGF